MTRHKTGTREEWLAARLELLEAEKELTRRSDELARRRQELPWVRVDKEYRFETDEGSASNALVYHFIFKHQLHKHNKYKYPTKQPLLNYTQPSNQLHNTSTT